MCSVVSWNSAKRREKHAIHLAKEVYDRLDEATILLQEVRWPPQALGRKFHIFGAPVPSDAVNPEGDDEPRDGGTRVCVPTRLLRFVRDHETCFHYTAVAVGRMRYVSMHLRPAGLLTTAGLEDVLAQLTACMARWNRDLGAGYWVIGVDANTAAGSSHGGVCGAALWPPDRGRQERGRAAVFWGWVAEQGLIPTNTHCSQKKGRNWTWQRWAQRCPHTGRRRRGRRTRAQIDFILASEGLAWEVVVRRPCRGAGRSDHRALWMAAHCPQPDGWAPQQRDSRRPGPGWRPNSLADEEHFRREVQQALGEGRATDVHSWAATLCEAALRTAHTTTWDRRRQRGAATDEERRARWTARFAAAPDERRAAARSWRRLRRARRRAETAASEAAGTLLEKHSRRQVLAVRRPDGSVAAGRADCETLLLDYLAQLWGVQEEPRPDPEPPAPAPGLPGGAPGPLATSWDAFLDLLGKAAGRSGCVGTDGVSGRALQLLTWDQKRALYETLTRVTATDYPPEWQQLQVVPIPKDGVRACPSPKQLRYLGLGAGLQKVHAGMITHACPAPAPHIHLGYEAGRCTEDVAGFIREAVAAAVRWSDTTLKVVVCSIDILRAFDCVDPQRLRRAMLDLGHGREVADLVLQSLLGLQVTLAGGTEQRSFRKARGLRTGGCESPRLLNILLGWAAGPTVMGWKRDGVGYGGRRFLSACWWADNLYILAKTPQEAAIMVAELTAAVTAAGLAWKPESAEVLQAPRPPHGNEGHWHPQGGPRFRRVRTLKVLGSEITDEADHCAELQARLRKADGVWWALDALWRSRAASVASKVRAYVHHVQTVVAGGAGGLHLCQQLLLDARAWENRKLRRLARQRPARGAADGAAHYRAQAAERAKLLHAAGGRPLAEALLTAYHRRAGALARHEVDQDEGTAGLRWLLRRSAMDSWWANRELMEAVDPANELEWRHARPGRPRWEWTEILRRAAGPDWLQQAATPAWNSSCPAFRSRALLACGLAGGAPAGGGAVGVGVAGAAAPAPGPLAPAPPPALTTASLAQRSYRHDAALWRQRGPALEAVVDAKAVALAAVGQVRAPRAATPRALWSTIQGLAQAATERGLTWRRGSPVTWQPRALNTAADALCTWAMLRGVRTRWACPDRGSAEANWRVFSDGGRREVDGTVRVAWAALLFAQVGALWRLQRAGAGLLQPHRADVPAAEAFGLAQGLRLWLAEAGTNEAAVALTPAEGSLLEPARSVALDRATVAALEWACNATWAVPDEPFALVALVAQRPRCPGPAARAR